MEVVAYEPVGDRRLGRGGVERRVGVDRGHRGVEARVRDAPDPDLAVVEADALQEPLDRVPGVARLVHVLRALGGVEGPHVHELALRHEAAPHVLVDEDEPLLRRRFRGAHAVGVGVAPVGRDAVGRAVEQDRIPLGATGVLRDVDGGEQLHPVAHRDAVLVLGEARPHGIGGVGGGRARGQGRDGGRAGEGDEKRNATGHRSSQGSKRDDTTGAPGSGRPRRSGPAGARSGQRAAGALVADAEEGVDGRPEALRLLDRGEVAALLEDHELRTREPVGQHLHPLRRQQVVRPGDHEAPHRDGGQPASRVEGRQLLVRVVRVRPAQLGVLEHPGDEGPALHRIGAEGSGSSPRATSSAAGRSDRRRRAPASTRRPSGRRSSSSAPGAAPAWPSCPRPRGSPCRGRRSRRRASPGAPGPAR